MGNAPANRMLTAIEAAHYCGFKSVNGFQGYIRVAPVKFGKNVRYDRNALDRELDKLSDIPQLGTSPSAVVGNASKNHGA